MTATLPEPNAWVGSDVVIFSVHDGQLVVLLVRRTEEPFAGAWALPGGLLGVDETLEACAKRILVDKTGLAGVYLEQLYTFGRVDRDPRGRVLSVAYYALVPYHQLTRVRGGPEIAWHDVDGPPALAFDHGRIVHTARERLAAKLEYSTIALQLMPERFTLSELQGVYETILGAPLDKRNFRKRIQGLGCLEPTGEELRGGSHRPARLYRVKEPGRVAIVK